MAEHRDYTADELLTWCRFETLLLLGSLLAYTGQREGRLEHALDFLAQRLGDVFSGSQGVESAMLGLRLNLEALGVEIRSTSVSPEAGELVVGGLPSAPLVEDLEERFEVAVTPDELLGLIGLPREELERLYDLLGSAAAGSRLAYDRAPLEGGWRLTLRA